ncbi:MAG: cell division protein FtsQ [Actinomycetota bacterium]|nr:cell division protein FtsQ [Actinomycetota bacterium]
MGTTRGTTRVRPVARSADGGRPTLSTSFAARFARRVWRRRWSRLRVGLILLLVGAIVAGAGWVVLFSSVLGVRTVDVTGTHRLSPAHVRAVARIVRGTPLARIDEDAITRRLMQLRTVRAVTISRQWPSTVQIEVQERVPAAVRADGGSFTLVDRSGVGFATVAHKPKRLPVVRTTERAGPAAVRVALDALDALPPRVRHQVLRVGVASPHAVRMVLTRHRVVVWGDGEGSARKAAVLAVLLHRKARVYDVSAPDAPTTRR